MVWSPGADTRAEILSIWTVPVWTSNLTRQYIFNFYTSRQWVHRGVVIMTLHSARSPPLSDNQQNAEGEVTHLPQCLSLPVYSPERLMCTQHLTHWGHFRKFMPLREYTVWSLDPSISDLNCNYLSAVIAPNLGMFLVSFDLTCVRFLMSALRSENYRVEFDIRFIGHVILPFF